MAELPRRIREKGINILQKAIIERTDTEVNLLADILQSSIPFFEEFLKDNMPDLLSKLARCAHYECLPASTVLAYSHHSNATPKCVIINGKVATFGRRPMSNMTQKRQKRKAILTNNPNNPQLMKRQSANYSRNSARSSSMQNTLDQPVLELDFDTNLTTLFPVLSPTVSLDSLSALSYKSEYLTKFYESQEGIIGAVKKDIMCPDFIVGICLEPTHVVWIDNQFFTQTMLEREERLCQSSAEYFSKLPLFSNFSMKFLRELFAKTQIRKFVRGDIVFKEGTPADSVYIVYKGEFNMLKQFSIRKDIAPVEDEFTASLIQKQKEQSLPLFYEKNMRRIDIKVMSVFESEVIGETSLLNQASRQFSLTCESLTGELFVFTREYFENKVFQYEDLIRDIQTKAHNMNIIFNESISSINQSLLSRNQKKPPHLIKLNPLQYQLQQTQQQPTSPQSHRLTSQDHSPQKQHEQQQYQLPGTVTQSPISTTTFTTNTTFRTKKITNIISAPASPTTTPNDSKSLSLSTARHLNKGEEPSSPQIHGGSYTVDINMIYNQNQPKSRQTPTPNSYQTTHAYYQPSQQQSLVGTGTGITTSTTVNSPPMNRSRQQNSLLHSIEQPTYNNNNNKKPHQISLTTPLPHQQHHVQQFSLPLQDLHFATSTSPDQNQFFLQQQSYHQPHNNYSEPQDQSNNQQQQFSRNERISAEIPTMEGYLDTEHDLTLKEKLACEILQERPPLKRELQVDYEQSEHYKALRHKQRTSSYHVQGVSHQYKILSSLIFENKRIKKYLFEKVVDNMSGNSSSTQIPPSTASASATISSNVILNQNSDKITLGKMQVVPILQFPGTKPSKPATSQRSNRSNSILQGEISRSTSVVSNPTTTRSHSVNNQMGLAQPSGMIPGDSSQYPAAAYTRSMFPWYSESNHQFLYESHQLKAVQTSSSNQSRFFKKAKRRMEQSHRQRLLPLKDDTFNTAGASQAPPALIKIKNSN